MGNQLESKYAQQGTVLLVHGAFHGAWCWDLVVEGLTNKGVAVRALDLPGHGESQEALAALEADASAVRSAIADCQGPVVLCGHSYGGVVITEAVSPGDSVQHLVYIAAGVPDVGECMLENMSGEDGDALSAAIRVPRSGVIEVDPDHAAGIFYNDCDDEIAAWASARLDEQTSKSLVDRVSQAPWRDLDSTYVICSQDRVVPVSAQQVLAKRCSRSVIWDTSHSPMLSQPDRLVSLLTELAARVQR